jgi:hypothetical protein
MMFFGTYRSEFYRSVRNLLHDQVAEGQSQAVRRRWDELVGTEAQFRRREEGALVTRAAARLAP